MAEQSKSNVNVLSEFLREVKGGQENVLEVAKETLGGGKEKVTFAVQNRVLQPEPVRPPERAESPRRNHCFFGLPGFTAYLDRYATPDTVVFADVYEAAMWAVLDEKAATGFEIVRFRPQVHPLFEPWLKLLGTAVPVEAFAQFAMENRRVIQEPIGKDLAIMMSQVRASTTTTLQRGIGRRAVNGIVCTTEIQGERDTQTVELPDAVVIECPLFVARPAQRFEIDLTLGVKDNCVMVGVTSADVVTAKIAAFDAMLETLRAGQAVVTMGKPEHVEWKYLR